MDIRTAHAPLSWFKQIRSEVREIIAKIELSNPRHFAPLLDACPDEVWDEIAKLYEIKIHFVPMPRSLHALCPFFEEAARTRRGYNIWINTSLLEIEDPILRKAMVRSAGFHELAHIISHGPFRVDDQNASAARTALDGYARDPIVNRLLEARTELLAAEMAFAPENKFLETFLLTAGNFRQMMEKFGMPLDCCIKWALITDTHPPAHYVKYNVKIRTVEDNHQPKEHPYDVFAFSLDETLFEPSRQTVASHALEIRDDHEGTAPVSGSTQRFHCKAYFMKSDAALQNPEKIVVIGFPQDRHERLIAMQKMLLEKPNNPTQEDKQAE